MHKQRLKCGNHIIFTMYFWTAGHTIMCISLSNSLLPISNNSIEIGTFITFNKLLNMLIRRSYVWPSDYPFGIF